MLYTHITRQNTLKFNFTLTYLFPNGMKPKPIINEALVAEKIKVDYANGIIAEKKVLIERILIHDQEICKSKGESKKYSKKSISKSTLYRFLTKFGLSTPKEYQEEKKMCSAKDKEIEIERYDNMNDDAESNTTDLDEKVSLKSLKFFETKILQDEDAEEVKEQNDNAIMIQYQDAKIKELTKICCGLSNKIPPSSLLHLSWSLDSKSNLDVDVDLENNRSLHLCIRAIIQILSPVKQLTEWIMENDFLIVHGITPDDPFQQLANTWFWDGVLKYEALENDQKSEILKRFGHHIKELCEKHDQIFGTTIMNNKNLNVHQQQQKQVFIPPPPQKILDMIIQQHHNHFIDDLPNGESYDLPNLPFKKIELIPPKSTKPFGKVSFCSWKPSLFSSPLIQKDNTNNMNNLSTRIDEEEEEEDEEAEILFAELTWNKDKLTYVHFAWPQCGEEGEDVILEKGWHYYSSGGRREIKTTQSDYQMIGAIWGKQFVGDWIRYDGLLPHLGINNPPVTYIYATKRNTSPENPKQGRWYLCLDDNYISSFRPLMLTNNFQDVLLYMDNDQRRTYRPQLLVFQKLGRRRLAVCAGSDDKGGRDSSPVSIEQYEPNLQKQKIANNSSSLDSLYHQSNTMVAKRAITNSSSQRKETSPTSLKKKRNLIRRRSCCQNLILN
jgi:hypothetical protein